ncbi:hypothetical protein ACC848_39330, partial [Rhizobium johnstonii]
MIDRLSLQIANAAQPKIAIACRLGAALLALVPATGYAVTPSDANQQHGEGLSDIVVTAQRRTENSQTVPISIQMLDARSLDTL